MIRFIELFRLKSTHTVLKTHCIVMQHICFLTTLGVKLDRLISRSLMMHDVARLIPSDGAAVFLAHVKGADPGCSGKL